MKKIELEIVALSHSESQKSFYAVVLGEMSGLRRLDAIRGREVLLAGRFEMRFRRPQGRRLRLQFIDGLRRITRQALLFRLRLVTPQQPQ